MDIGTNYSYLYANNKKQKRKTYTNGSGVPQKRMAGVPLDGMMRPAQMHQYKKHTLLRQGEGMDSLCVKNPQRYITTQKQRQEIYRRQYIQAQQSLDGVKLQKAKGEYVQKTKQEQTHVLQNNLIQNTYNAFAAYRNALHLNISPTRMWQLSLTGAMIFGMVSMSLIYRNLGQSAFANENTALAIVEDSQITEVVENSEDGDEKTEGDEKKVEKSEDKKEIIKEQEKKSVVMADIVEKKDVEDKSVEEEEVTKKTLDSASQKIEEKVNESDVDEDDAPVEIEEEKTFEELAYETVEGYPIAKMLPYILEQDQEVAKYLIAIAKQESGWGKRVPVLNGQDCYNYWGYRGTRKLMGSGGHTCFNSRKDAVETVGKRIKELVYEYDRKTADRLIVWKCGSSCEGHSQAGVDRWIGVVSTYYDKLSKSKDEA
jgi:hypothetical protein